MKSLLRNLISAGVVACVWFAAVAVETMARLLAGAFVEFGADLPFPTLVTIEAVRGYAPWVIAVLSTASILYLRMRADGDSFPACAAISGIVLLLTACAALALVLPFVKCGVMWPDWPGRVASWKSAPAPSIAASAGALGSASVLSCK